MADSATGWAVLLPIRKQHAANIYAGTKTVELRKTVPRVDPGSYTPSKYPFRVYLYESKTGGGAGAVTGYFSCPGYTGTCGQYMEDMAQRAQVSMDYLLEYAAGGWVYGWEVTEPTRLPEPVALSALGIDRAPPELAVLGDRCLHNFGRGRNRTTLVVTH